MGLFPMVVAHRTEGLGKIGGELRSTNAASTYGRATER
jgi:hypothetical protein